MAFRMIRGTKVEGSGVRRKVSSSYGEIYKYLRIRFMMDNKKITTQLYTLTLLVWITYTREG